MTAVKDVAAVHTIAYNGVSFGPLVRYSLDGQPVYDGAGRTVTHTRYVLRVMSWENATTEDLLSASILTKRELLMQPGAALTIADIGIGDTTTGMGGSHPDLVWGARPQRFSLRPLGGGVCWQLDWAIEFNVQECNTSVSAAANPWMAWNYQCSYSNDEVGFTDRVVSGYVQIPQVRLGRQANDTPINHRNGLDIQVPHGYRRTASQWQENAARNRLNFSVVDRQLRDEPYPVGISQMSLSFNFASRGLGFEQWQFTASGQFETQPGAPKSHAGLQFFRIVFSRVNHLIAHLPNKHSALIPESIRMGHKATSRQSSYAISIRVVGPLRNLLQQSALYEPLPDSNYQRWRTTKFAGVSMEDLWRNGGQTNLKTSAHSDKIVDLCKPTRRASVRHTSGRPLIGPPLVKPEEVFACDHITEENSWLMFEPRVTFLRDEMLGLQKKDKFVSPLGLIAPALKEAIKLASPLIGAPFPKKEEDKLVRLGLPEQAVILSVRALRLKFAPVPYGLSKIGGVKLEFVGGIPLETEEGPVFFDCRSIFGRWLHIYRPQGHLREESLNLKPWTIDQFVRHP